MDRPTVRIARLHGAHDLPLPAYQTLHSSGMDLCAAVTEPVIIQPGERVLVPTGFAVAVPPEYEAQVRPRSGLAVHYGITVLNSPGTIDADYRGEVKLIIVNHGTEPFTVERGRRLAQLVVQPVARAMLVEVEGLDVTERSAGGFGHTGR
ncbi:MAG: dUTP diphosphatase [Verrucomicrobia bacterium]|nr:dUTP diphosphatase [Verrucomicrobiota bacterium]